MTLIQRAYEAAKNDLNFDWKEVPGKGSNPRIKACYKAVDGLGNPEMIDDDWTSWCSCYVNKKIQDAGGKGTRSALARSWLAWGKEIKKPVEGCIVVFKRGNSTWQGHVGFFVKKDETHVWCLGGNQSNNLKISKYKIEDVLGYRVSLDC